MKSFHARTPRPPTEPDHVPAVVERKASAGTRADQVLVARGLADSRTSAQRLIAAGRVGCRGERGIEPVAKASQAVPAGMELLVTPSDDDRYVSRGGLKLAGALAHTGLAVRDRVCLDVGQSTGGFTDCLLQAGAARVVGVDVGHDQLHPRLRTDERVTSIEGINARALTADMLDEHYPENGFDLVVADLSFISLTLVLPQLPALLAADGDMLLLVKPQFEMGSPEAVGKGGVIRDAAVYPQVAAKLRAACVEAGLNVRAWFESSIVGGDGNREFFLWLNHE
ncbi:MAG: TlyA family RNA methyltransferase [Rhodocyclaceae bacterium]|nr:TlyA family RNA methyltransferase [Rhodocyclaceae bacterium]